jgi:hypothetical protein
MDGQADNTQCGQCGREILTREEIQSMIDDASMSGPEIRLVVRDELRKGLREILGEELRQEFRTQFTALGIELGDPIQNQADARFLRRLRTGAENAGSKIVATVVGATVLGLIGVMVLGFVAWIRSKLEG